MKQNNHVDSITYLFFIISFGVLDSRSPFRPIEVDIPIIHVHSSLHPEQYTLKDSHITPACLLLFNEPYFNEHCLPDTIEGRQGHDPVQGDVLSTIIERTLEEVNEKQKEFTYCTILQDRDFNRRRKCGLLVLKCKEYPFVIKLFIETPESFANPHCKGLIPSFLFYMAGGVTRHTSGFTRLKNAENIRLAVAQDPLWCDIITVPRKWFWISQNPEWLEITGHNIGHFKTIQTRIPAVYAIVADAIESERSFELRNKEDRALARAICQFLQVAVDPHITNFMYEKETRKVAIIDTEHFPTIVGLEKPYSFNNYSDWYLYLTNKCLKDMLFRTKKTRKLAVAKTPTHVPFV